MITQIGIVAGEIWHLLDERGEVSFSDILNSIQREREIILMSLGWLAREGHVSLRQEGSEYKVNLR